MEFNSKCKILKIYVNEDSRYKGHNLYHAVVLKLKEIGMAGVTVIRGVEGYGHNKAIHTARILDLSFSLPVVIEVVDIPERIEKAIPIVKEMVDKGLILLTDVNVIKYGNIEFDETK